MKLTKRKPAGLILPTIAFTAAAALSVTTSNAALLFYEDFSGYTSGVDASIDGQGGWTSPNDSFEVRSGTIGTDGGSGTWDGTIEDSSTSGGNFIAPDFGGTVGLADILLPSNVTNSFTAGTTTWLSYVEYNAAAGGGARQNLAIGAAPLTGLDSGIVGGGIGVATTNNNTPRAAYWTTTAEVASGSTIGSGRPILVVAKIEWGSDPASLDQITVKRFGDASVTESEFNNSTEQSVASFALDQSTFDTLSIASQYAWFDDIRIANDFNSAISGTNVIPEPTAALLGVLGCSLLLLRRRR